MRKDLVSLQVNSGMGYAPYIAWLVMEGGSYLLTLHLLMKQNLMNSLQYLGPAEDQY